MFVGVGVSTFYTGPQYPKEPDEVAYIDVYENGETTEEIKQARKDYDKAWDAYQDEEKDYSRVVAIVTMVFALVLLYLGISQAEKLVGISEGVLLGGIFTLFYSLIRGLMSGDDIVRFLVIAVGLVIALWLGNKKFVQDTAMPKKTSKE